MSKRTIGLILVLIIVSGLLVFFALDLQKSQAPKEVVKIPSPTPTPVAQTIISLSPNPLIISSSSATINVDVDSKENNLIVVQLELSFDPKMISVTDITPSTFFTTPLVLYKKIDAENGKITYAIAVPPGIPPKKGTGTVATINITNFMIEGQQTQITALPKSLASAVNINSSVLKQITGMTIIFSKPIILPPTTSELPPAVPSLPQ
ncbi:MAG: cohesin domain-containing protein [Candidatus Levyibacteriota bacterium]